MPKTILMGNNHGRGVALMLFSTLSFGVMQIFVAMTGGEISIIEQTFFRNLVGLIVVGIVAARKRIPFFGERKYQPLLFARSVVGFISVMLLFYAARNAAQADVTIIVRTGMFTISLVSALFLGEKLTKMHLPAMIIAFAGAFIAANPRFDSSFLPLLAAFAISICDTVCYPLLSYFSGRVNPLTVVMHFCTFSTVLAGVLMAKSFVMPSGYNLFCLLMIGVSAALGQICMTYAYRMAPAGELSVYNQLAIMFNAVLAFLFLNETPSARTLLGGALVLLASVLLFAFKQRHKDQQTAASKQ